jgi:hypothetical protein
MNVAVLGLTVCGFLMFATPAARGVGRAQVTAGDPLQPLAFLIGRWEGTSEGQPGAAKVQREYARVLNSRFIRGQNQSVYPPQEKNPKGETHEDLGIFSFDTSRRRAILRQFHVEGFVNQYVADLDPQLGKLVFTSEAIENIPPGWRARESYVVLGPDEFRRGFRTRGTRETVRAVLARATQARSMTLAAEPHAVHGLS